MGKRNCGNYAQISREVNLNLFEDARMSRLGGKSMIGLRCFKNIGVARLSLFVVQIAAIPLCRGSAGSPILCTASPAL